MEKGHKGKKFTGANYDVPGSKLSEVVSVHFTNDCVPFNYPQADREVSQHDQEHMLTGVDYVVITQPQTIDSVLVARLDQKLLIFGSSAKLVHP